MDCRRATLFAVAEPAPNEHFNSSRIVPAERNRERHVSFLRPHAHASNASTSPSAGRSRSTIGYWKQRLIHRPYPEARLSAGPEYSVRMEQEGSYNYFPLGSNREDIAAAKALEIHRAILRGGWQAATEVFEQKGK